MTASPMRAAAITGAAGGSITVQPPIEVETVVSDEDMVGVMSVVVAVVTVPMVDTETGGTGKVVRL
ncbi:MAG: hypothetical protein OEW30_21640, partial [Acidimicrobiia bacterium]|nr:hypothetical protein [Acidimicrobiia bacterium]